MFCSGKRLYALECTTDKNHPTLTICSVRAESFRTADVHQTVTNSEREMHTTAPWLRGYVKAKQFKPKINCLGPCSALGTLVFARKSNSE